MQSRFARKLSALTVLFSCVLSLAPARAATFNPNLILSDAEIRDADAMSYPEIAAFLRAKGGLWLYADVDAADGLLKSSAQIVADAAKRHQVNPKYLLALIQKESSAVETRIPMPSQLEWATGYALCDACFKSAPLPQKYRGFGRQVDAGAAWMDWYLQNAAINPAFKRAGDILVINGTELRPESTATAALYSYTPHLHGNRLLWSVLNRWFGDGKEVPRFPDGTVVRTDSGETGVLQAGKLRLIGNPSVLASRFGNVPIVAIPGPEFASLKQNAYARPLRFPDLSLVRDETGRTYLLTGTKKRLIPSKEIFAKVGFNPEEIEDVRSEDLADYADGAPVTAVAAVGGQLLQDTKTGGVYFVEDGVKRPVWDRALLVLRFPAMPITPASKETLAKYKDAEPVRLPDGAVVKAANDPSVYLISGGQRRSFKNEDAFHLVGYRWTDVVTVNPKLLALHPIGETILAY